jgi:hypothetical protein
MASFGFRIFALSATLATAAPLLASTNTISADEIPALRPPRTEMEPTFWEQYGAWPVVGGLLVLAIVGVGLWLLLRSRPQAPIPPATQARHDLEPLRNQPETGLLLSRVSQVLRHYAAAAFGLPAGELTTTEFASAIAGQEQVGPELSGAMSQFLRDCDQRKFAQLPPPQPLGAVDQAANLIELAEARRLQRAAARSPRR